MVKNLPSNARDAGSIPASARMKGGKGCPLQCSCLGNPTDRAAWQARHGVTRESVVAERLNNNKVFGEF